MWAFVNKMQEDQAPKSVAWSVINTIDTQILILGVKNPSKVENEFLCPQIKFGA